MKKLYVRVQPKQSAVGFFRCGMKFTKAWTPVEVDAATAARLEAEQMLEVSETKPADLENETPNEADASGDSSTVEVPDTPAAAPEPEAVVETEPAPELEMVAETEPVPELEMVAETELVPATPAKSKKAGK